MFEHSLIDLETRQQPRRRWISLPVAIFLHLAAFTTFAFGSYWNVGAVPEPQTNMEPVVMFALPPPPPPPAGGGHPNPAPTPATAPQPAQRPTVQQPTVVPSHLEPVRPSTEEAVTPVPGPPTTPGPNIGDGPDVGPPGPGPGPGPGNWEGPADSAPVRLSAEMTPPVPIEKVQPRYTENARRAGIQGIVVVEAIIDEQGRVTNVRVLRGLPMGLDRAAVEAIQQWRFKPALLEGRPVKVYFTLTANFTLQR